MGAREVQRALADPFPASVVGWKAQTVKGARALAVAYIDARDVMDRLDDVAGVDGWEDSYADLPGGSVLCTLRVRVGGVWVAKQDVGGESDQPDKGDKAKAAHSDALKRAAVKFGVGRYLYSLPAVWADYDANKKQLAGTPQLPPWALPGGSGRLHAAPATHPPGPGPAKADEPAEIWRAALAKAAAAGKLAGLAATWREVPPELQAKLATFKDELKAGLAPAEPPSPDRALSLIADLRELVEPGDLDAFLRPYGLSLADYGRKVPTLKPGSLSELIAALRAWKRREEPAPTDDGKLPGMGREVGTPVH